MLRCIGCRSGGLVDGGGLLACPCCGRAFPVRAEIPVMIGDAVADRGPLLEPEQAAGAMARLGIAPGPINALRVRRASGARVRLQAGGGGWLPHDGRVLPGGLPVPPTSCDASEGDPAVTWLGEYLPRRLPPGDEVLANVRFRNAGAVPMRHAGEGRVTVACQWGGAEETGDVRTPLPAELAPGGVLTLPLRLRAPGQPGRYTLTVGMVQEGVRWLEPAFGPFCVDVAEGAGWAPPPAWVMDGPGPHEEAADRARAAALMRDWMSRHAPPQPRVLELGGGAAPAVRQPGWDGFVLDDDLLALQLGRLLPGPPVPSACGDWSDLPLPERAFDAAVSFGGLHYQPDPARALRRLRAHLRPDGFIALFCLPVGQMWPGAPSQALLAELRRGLNPQGFSAAEWAGIFASARLRVAELVVDGASMKARLQPEGADA